MKDRSIFTIAVALVSFVTLAAPLVSMSGAWLEQEGRIVRSDISFGRGHGSVIDGAPRVPYDRAAIARNPSLTWIGHASFLVKMDGVTEEDIQVYAEDYALHGERAFTGAFNWYRNIERNNELLAPFRGLTVDVPALYVVGDRDMITSLRAPNGGGSLSDLLRGQGVPGNPLSAVARQLHGPVVLPGCGHWTQQSVPPRSTPHSSTSSPASTARCTDDTTRNPPGRHRSAGATPKAHSPASRGEVPSLGKFPIVER